MDYNYSKRGYLLPKGCKDLIDVLKLEAQHHPGHPQTPLASPFPLIAGALIVPEKMTVLELATLLKQKPFKIIADMMETGIFASVNQQIDFGVIARVAKKYGYTAMKAFQG
jgi:hypothetical protein